MAQFNHAVAAAIARRACAAPYDSLWVQRAPPLGALLGLVRHGRVQAVHVEGGWAERAGQQGCPQHRPTALVASQHTAALATELAQIDT